MWSPISAQLVEEEDVLPYYDAKGVAEVMGLAFVRRPKESGGHKNPAAPVSINVDGDTMLIVGRFSEVKGRRVSSPSPIFIEKAVESGLPRESLQHVAEAIAGGDKAKASALERGIVPKTTLERRESKLSRRESERTERVARIFVRARRALGTEAEAREFMTTAHPELEGRSPLDAAKTDLGARRAEQILNALEFGLALTGASFALCLIEVLVHANRKSPPSAARCVEAVAPDDVSRETFAPELASRLGQSARSLGRPSLRP